MSHISFKNDESSKNPLDDHSCSLYTSFVHKRHSYNIAIAQLTFIIGKLSSFILNKQYQYFPTAHNITEDIKNALPKHIFSSNDPSIAPPTAVVTPTPSSYVLHCKP